MRIVALAAAVLAAITLGACGRGGGGDERIVLDGRPRIPDVEGVVAEVSFDALTLQGGKTYRITRDLQCFSTYTLASVPLLERKGQYVQLGLDGDRVAWLASIGGLIRNDPPSVYYTGTFVDLGEGRRAVFRDGTTFELGEGVEPPAPGFVQVAIDPATRLVRQFF